MINGYTKRLPINPQVPNSSGDNLLVTIKVKTNPVNNEINPTLNEINPE